MKKLCIISVLLLFAGFLVFANTEKQEEIDFLLFLPNSNSQFVNEELAKIQLDNLAKYLAGRDLISGQIYVYGYAAVVSNNIDPVSLSRNRALFVINELQKRGIPRNLFSDPIGYGAVDLWGSNIYEEDRSPNRRVSVVLDGYFITVEPATGQVIESEVPVLTATETADAEIEIHEVSENAPIRPKNTTDLTRKKFPWWILFPLFLLFIPFIFSKKRRRPFRKTAKPKKAESSATVQAAAPAATSEKIAPVVAAAATATDESIVYLEEEIRRRAYEHYLMRNGENGSMDGDWYKALPEICAKYAAVDYKIYYDGSWWARKSFSRKI